MIIHVDIYVLERMKVLVLSALRLQEVEDERAARKHRRRMLAITKRQKRQRLVILLLLCALFNTTTIHRGVWTRQRLV